MVVTVCTCGASWSGANICHCGACHRTFTSISAFDSHRSARKADKDKRIKPRIQGLCYDPGDNGLVMNERGQWGRPPAVTEWYKKESAADGS